MARINYISYLQAGGQTVSMAQQLAQALQANDPKAKQVIQELQVRAQQNDQKAIAILQELQSILGGNQMKNGGKVNPLEEFEKAHPHAAEQLEALKCGGKAKKKVPKKRMGGCPCLLKRVGGKIIQVTECAEPKKKIKFQQGGRVDIKYWHNRRYTPEQIRKIQSSLNKQALGKQIAVDGIIGPETIAAIRRFQEQHSDILAVDGLVGDQTMSALGLTGIGDSSLTSTRRGQYQGRQEPGKISGVSDAENERMRKYYNTPEMLDYLLNANNTRQPQYYNHYQNALNYVSPEVAARLRNINDEGDSYDAEVSRNHNQARNRKIGILEAKRAMEAGQLKTPEQIDKWMTVHNLSKEEMNEIMRDPEMATASLASGIRADNGRVNSQASQAKRFQQDVTNAMNDAGANYALPAWSLGTGLVTAPIAAVGSLAGGYLFNKGTNYLSNDKYQTWGQLMSDKTNTPEYQWLWELSNPGAIAGGLAGGFAGGYRPGTKAIKTRVPNPKAGQTYIAKAAKIPKFVGTQVSEVVGGNTAFVPGKVPGGFGIGTAPVYKMISRPNLVRSYPSTISKTIVPGTKSSFHPEFYSTFQTNVESSQPNPVIIPEITYNTGVTYGPYNGFNRF